MTHPRFREAIDAAKIKRTKYVSLPNLTIAEAEALVRIVSQCVGSFEPRRGSEIMALKRAERKLEAAIKVVAVINMEAIKEIVEETT